MGTEFLTGLAVFLSCLILLSGLLYVLLWQWYVEEADARGSSLGGRLSGLARMCLLHLLTVILVAVGAIAVASSQGGHIAGLVASTASVGILAVVILAPWLGIVCLAAFGAGRSAQSEEF